MTDDLIHRFPIRVYFEDTDAGQVVYHASYLRFAERGRTEMLRDLGYPHTQLIERHGLIFVLARIEIDYLSPGRLDEALTVVSKIVHIGRSSVRMSQDITAEDGTARAKLLVRLVAVNKEGRPSALPEEFLAHFPLPAL
jgi:acyl-CoA thioester hydrolase